jgi:hypothetical protein
MSVCVTNGLRGASNSALHDPRFSEVEQLAILTTILLQYRVEVMEEPQFSNETIEDRRGRILGAVRKSLVLSPNKVPLVFKPREGSMFRGGH